MRDNEVDNEHKDLPVFFAKKGQRFRLPPEYGDLGVFVFDHMDGIYAVSHAETDPAERLSWSGPVVLVDDEKEA